VLTLNDDKNMKDLEEHNNDNEIPSFNSVTEHYHNIVGYPNKKIIWSTMPKVLRWFGYFFFTVMGIGAIVLLFIIIISLFH